MSTIDDTVSTVVIVVMENRSFDHMLGHLSLEGLVPNVDGLKAPLSQYENLYAGDPYAPFKAQDHPLTSDLPHEWDFVETQLAKSPASGRYTMTGFVEAYARYTQKPNPGPTPDPMGFFPSNQLPVTSFLARTYCTCDNWYAPLPSSTQPNRIMAWCGSTPIFDTKSSLISTNGNLLDWLDRPGDIDWHVYHDGLSFFALLPEAWPHVLGSRFHDFETFLYDMKTRPPGKREVIIVEPSYQDGPHVGSDRPNDNHPPLAVGWGEEFLRRTYEAVTANPERWAKTVMLLYYDEHGGFFDHVSPKPIPYQTTGNPSRRFETTGPRVPALVISPLVARGSVCKELFDHTSVLQFLAERFTPGAPYSAEVDARSKLGIASLSKALLATPRTDTAPAPSTSIQVSTTLGSTVASPPQGDMQKAFESAAVEMMNKHPDEVGQKYPELFQWKAAADAARGVKP